MTSANVRFDFFAYMRALEASDLPPLTRWLGCVLGREVDGKTGKIRPSAMPSLTDLQRKSGMSRDAVAKHLARLEADGWLLRVQPPVHKARTEHARTQYRPLMKASTGDVLAPPVDNPPVDNSGLVRETDQPGTGDVLGLVRETDCKERPTTFSTKSARTPAAATPPASPRVQPTTDREDLQQQETNAVRKALHERTGKLVDIDHAQRVIKQLLGDRAGVKNRVAYLVGAIEKDDDPRRFLPHSLVGPPRFTASMLAEGA